MKGETREHSVIAPLPLSGRKKHAKFPVRIVELKLAAVFYGGVSLVVYMYGQIMEINNLLRAGYEFEKWCNGDETYLKGEPLESTAEVYLALLQRIYNKYGIELHPILDIASGTSAGGILACVLAKVLSNNNAGNLESLRNIVLDKFDADELKAELESHGMGFGGYIQESWKKGFITTNKRIAKTMLLKMIVKGVMQIDDHDWPGDFLDTAFYAIIKQNKAVFSGEKLKALVSEAFNRLDDAPNSNSVHCYNTKYGVTVFAPVTDIDSYGKVMCLGEPIDSFLFRRVQESQNRYTLTFNTSKDDFNTLSDVYTKEFFHHASVIEETSENRVKKDNCDPLPPLLLAIRATSAFPFLFPGIQLVNEFKCLNDPAPESGSQSVFNPFASKNLIATLKIREQFRTGTRRNKFEENIKCNSIIDGLFKEKQIIDRKLKLIRIRAGKLDEVEELKPLNEEERELVDGGLTNNKPYEPVLEKLDQRRQGYGLCVDRRLIFLDPHPEPSTIPQISDRKEKAMKDAYGEEAAKNILLPTFKSFKQELITTADASGTEKQISPGKRYADNIERKHNDEREGNKEHIEKRRKAINHNFGTDFQYLIETAKMVTKVALSESIDNELKKLLAINRKRQLKLEQRIHYIDETAELVRAIDKAGINGAAKDMDLEFQELINLYDPFDHKLVRFSKKLSEILAGEYEKYIDLLGKAFPNSDYQVSLRSRHLKARESDCKTSFTELLNSRDWIHVERDTFAHAKLEHLISEYTTKKYSHLEGKSAYRDLATTDVWFLYDIFNYGVRHLTNPSLWTKNLQTEVLGAETNVEEIREISLKAGKASYQLHAFITILKSVDADEYELNKDVGLIKLRAELNRCFWMLIDLENLLSEVEIMKLRLLYEFYDLEPSKEFWKSAKVDAENEKLKAQLEDLAERIREKKHKLENDFKLTLGTLDESFMNTAKKVFCNFISAALLPSAEEKSPARTAAWKSFKDAVLQNWLMDLHSFQTLSDPLGEFGTIHLKQLSPNNSFSLFRDMRQQLHLAGISAADVFLQSTKNYHTEGFFNRSYRENDMLWGHMDGTNGICTLLAEVVTKQLYLELETTNQFGSNENRQAMPYHRIPEKLRKSLSTKALLKKPELERYTEIYCDIHVEEYIRAALYGLLRRTDQVDGATRKSVREKIYQKYDDLNTNDIPEASVNANDFFKKLGCYLEPTPIQGQQGLELTPSFLEPISVSSFGIDSRKQSPEVFATVPTIRCNFPGLMIRDLLADTESYAAPALVLLSSCAAFAIPQARSGFRSRANRFWRKF